MPEMLNLLVVRSQILITYILVCQQFFEDNSKSELLSFEKRILDFIKTNYDGIKNSLTEKKHPLINSH